ncbi:protein N-lysine methyltransferase METTL21A isoform X1 [Amborella trichopoda]|uniref:protein N-lysine methyltransferase METTL21A isoform X1 n=1 Tax=Amborella trichopoda TaxID=13333 RepID=UPI0005D3326A|nr:protein N-lysine methyltransferase METTL21A isoform X1 [Amborella trichopoda]|eukprot:XP_011620735.1 protein N-lysine methyltransferase METTL21A isoform X1 [Amborella trichopoda]
MEGSDRACAEEEDMVCLDESFFINDNYQLTTFTFGSEIVELFCLQSASTDYDLTGQLVWPGAHLMNNYLSVNVHALQGQSIIELGSGVGVTGMLCGKHCREILLTDHKEEVLKVLKKNIELNSPSKTTICADLVAEKLEWGNTDQLSHILERYPAGFDLILGADICFQQASIPLLFDTVERLLRFKGGSHCKFILAYVSRAKTMDALIISEASRHGLQVLEVDGTRSTVGNHEGVIFEMSIH